MRSARLLLPLLLLALAACAAPPPSAPAPPPSAPAPPPQRRVQIARHHSARPAAADQTVYVIDDELGRVSVILDHARVIVDRRLSAGEQP